MRTVSVSDKTLKEKQPFRHQVEDRAVAVLGRQESEGNTVQVQALS